jgi:Transcriptional regulatory protein, C terminal
MSARVMLEPQLYVASILADGLRVSDVQPEAARSIGHGIDGLTLLCYAGVDILQERLWSVGMYLNCSGSALDSLPSLSSRLIECVSRVFALSELFWKVTSTMTKFPSVVLPIGSCSLVASQPGELKSREELAKEVWGDVVVGDARTIDVHIRRIRAALAEKKNEYEYLHTVKGLGYRFDVPSDDSCKADHPKSLA